MKHEKLIDRHIFTVHSQSGGAGVTATALGVAAELASRSYKVGIVDANFRAPKLTRFFAADIPDDKPGLVDILDKLNQGAIDITDSIETYFTEVKYQGENMFLLNAGQPDRESENYSGIIQRINFREIAKMNPLGTMNANPFHDLSDAFYRLFDYTIIDCETGTSDWASVCIAFLPDAVIKCIGDFEDMQLAFDSCYKAREFRSDSDDIRFYRSFPLLSRLMFLPPAQMQAYARAKDKFRKLEGNAPYSEDFLDFWLPLDYHLRIKQAPIDKTEKPYYINLVDELLTFQD